MLRAIAIHHLDDEGAGVALPGFQPEHPHTELHVAGALPGETIAAAIEHVSPHPGPGGRKIAWGRLGAIEIPSADRVPPLCAAYGRCGGCPMQHLAYARQLEWKTALVRNAFAALPELAGVTVQDCVGSPVTEHYRNQTRMAYGRTRAGRALLGAFAPRSHHVIDVAGCRLLEPPLEAVAATLRDLAAKARLIPHDPARVDGELRHVALRVNRAGRVLVTLVCPRPSRAVDALLAPLVDAHPEIAGVVRNLHPDPGDAIFGAQENTLWGEPALDDEIAGLAVRLSSRAFFQLNRQVAGLAYAAVQEEIAPGRVTHAVDVFAGVGVIARLMTGHADEVTAIESNPSAPPEAAAAKSRISFHVADAAAGLAGIASAQLIAVNPPRAGCAKPVRAELARLRPSRLIYLSCNPVSLARDLQAFVRDGYAVSRVTPFDMLPHTTHVETLAVLRR